MNDFWYYIFDVDGITLVNFGEDDTRWYVCNLEGEVITHENQDLQ